MNILVVDDDPETLQILKIFLESEHHTVILAERGEDALAHLEKDQAPLVFLDVRLPDHDGVDLLKTIRRKYPKVSVVVMTGFSEAETVVEAFRAGAMDCILKPFNFEYLKLNVLSRF